MTSREFLVAVVALASENGKDDIADKANDLIVKLDKKNAKRSSADSKQKKESSARRTSVLACITAEKQTADDIAEQCGITIGQARAALSVLVKDGKVAKASVKVGKSAKMMYFLPAEE